MIKYSKDIENYKTCHYQVFLNFASKIHSLLAELLADRGVPIAKIEHRAKSPESFEDKLKRKSYQNPINEITDLAGVRVVTYYNDDVYRVSDIVRQEFSVDNNHSSDKFAELGVDEFGYSSFHLVCSLQNPREVLMEWQQFSGLVVEVQVRSVLQHSWAAISHKLDYKSTSQAPAKLRRQLFRLSALLELADDQFTIVRNSINKINAEYKEEVQQGELNISLNLNSLLQYMKERVDLVEWEKIGKSIGMDEHTFTKTDVKLAAKHLLYTLQSLGIETIIEFDSLLKKHEPKARTVLKNFQKQLRANEGRFEAESFDIINVVLTISERKRLPERFEWPDYFYTPIRYTIKQLTKKSS